MFNEDRMPKTAACALIWSSEQDTYELRRRGDNHFLRLERKDWFALLIDDSSFAFQGRHGHLTMRKESRQHGEGYWYAYRNWGRKTLKKYAGRTSDLTIARLEEIAAALNAEVCSTHEREVSAREETQKLAYVTPPYVDTSTGQHICAPTTASSSQNMPFLTPKLSLPRLPATLITRTRLLAQLDAGLERKLTLLCAPAGSGKTTLVSQWIASHNEREDRPAAAWVSLDASDNDPIRFWSYVILACQGFQSAPGQEVLASLRTAQPASFEQPSLEAPLVLLLNELSQIPGKSVLVLEDYHLLTSPQISDSLAFLLEHLPASMHLVIITRTEPPLPLARLRASNELSELRAGELRFSSEETEAFLRQTLALPLVTSQILARLDAQIEGWATGLRLLSFALQGQESEQAIEQRLATLSGNHRHFLDYFVSEVLDAQPEEIQEFLLQTSILNSLTGALCDAVTGRSDSARTLETLERANLFLLPLAGEESWYRYHPLFAEALRHEVRRRSGDNVLRACSERASVWYEEQGLLTEAIEAALAARAFPRAARLIGRITGPQRFHEMQEHHTLHRWLDALPEGIRERHPSLCLTFAMVLLFASDCQVIVSADLLAQVEHPLRMAESAWRAEENRSGLGEVLAFRCVLARFQGDSAHSVRLARQALAWLPATAHQWRATCLGPVGDEELLAGELHTARQTFLEAHVNFAAAGNHYGIRIALLTLGEICFLQGKLHQAAELYSGVLASAGEDLSDRGKALLGLARVSYEWNDLATAEQQAGEARELGQSVADEALQCQASLILASIHQARGEAEHARQQFAALLARTQVQKSSLLHREILAHDASLQLTSGDLPAAQRWLTEQSKLEERLPLLQEEREGLLRARLLLAQGKIEDAQHLLEHWRTRAHSQGRARSEIEILLLLALGSFAQQNLPQTWQLLREALTLAHADGLLRIFLDEGEQLAKLLRAVLPMAGKKQPDAYVRILLLAFARQQPEQFLPTVPSTLMAIQPVEPLSEQEQRVLRLLTAGLSNTEIAETQVVSPNTVKTQVQSIYRKLNVHSRKEIREAMRGQNLP